MKTSSHFSLMGRFHQHAENWIYRENHGGNESLLADADVGIGVPQSCRQLHVLEGDAAWSVDKSSWEPFSSEHAHLGGN